MKHNTSGYVLPKNKNIGKSWSNVGHVWYNQEAKGGLQHQYGNVKERADKTTEQVKDYTQKKVGVALQKAREMRQPVLKKFVKWRPCKRQNTECRGPQSGAVEGKTQQKNVKCKIQQRKTECDVNMKSGDR